MGSSESEDRRVQARVTAALSAAGMPGRAVAQEALLLLPPDFVRAYEELFWRALSMTAETGAGATEGQLRDEGKQKKRASSSSLGIGSRDMGGTRGGARASRKHREHWTVKDEKALRLKAALDKELIELAGKVGRALADKDGVGKSTCSGCGRFTEAGWAYCPRCGGSLRSAS